MKNWKQILNVCVCVYHGCQDLDLDYEILRFTSFSGGAQKISPEMAVRSEHKGKSWIAEAEIYFKVGKSVHPASTHPIEHEGDSFQIKFFRL